EIISAWKFIFMKIYNTLTRQVEEFVPLDPPQVKFYACGPTVYDYAHIGHLRKYTMDDVLLRVMKHQGFQVKFVQNVTDVGHLASDADSGEDKLEKGAKKYSLDVWQIAKKFEDYFYRSMELMNNQFPDVVCRATDHIQEMLTLVETLEAKGYAYVIEGDGVYFDSSKFDDYAQLAQLDVEELMEGARVEKVEGKRHSTDFALWKFERPGENRAMVWSSKWHKRSFPGWHIECSAMSMKYLGPQIDIHTGGVDHIRVHHTNEIAQSEAATGKKPFVKYWVHHNFLTVDGEKMSKSKENFYTIDDVIEKGFEPMALRLLFLGAHYRSELNFTWDSLQAAQNSWDKLKETIAQLLHEARGEEASLSKLAQDYHDQFFTTITDDLSTPEALVVFWQMVKDKELSAAERLALLLDFDQLFGLELDSIQAADKKQPLALEELPDEARVLLQEREKARQQGDYAKSDQLRDQLFDLGFQVIDDESGQKVFAT
ncbi:MAG: Cysteine--tRNA ligase, partial [Microgenomates bacterium 39_7]